MKNRRTHPTFPDQKTDDQFFDEAQFEAYRMLGKCAVENLFRDELLGETVPKTLRAWFQSLANNLLPDNDAVFLKKIASGLTAAEGKKTKH